MVENSVHLKSELSKIKLPSVKEEFFLEDVWVFFAKALYKALRRIFAGRTEIKKLRG
jgi:hypothetical protein